MQGEIAFTLTYLLQLRICFGELPYQLRIRFVPGSVPFEESEKHPCVQEMFFSHGNKQRILSWTSRLQECSALVESLVCKHFSTFLIPCPLHNTFLYFLESVWVAWGCDIQKYVLAAKINPDIISFFQNTSNDPLTGSPEVFPNELQRNWPKSEESSGPLHADSYQNQWFRMGSLLLQPD